MGTCVRVCICLDFSWLAFAETAQETTVRLAARRRELPDAARRKTRWLQLGWRQATRRRWRRPRQRFVAQSSSNIYWHIADMPTMTLMVMYWHQVIWINSVIQSDKCSPTVTILQGFHGCRKCWKNLKDFLCIKVRKLAIRSPKSPEIVRKFLSQWSRNCPFGPQKSQEMVTKFCSQWSWNMNSAVRRPGCLLKV